MPARIFALEGFTQRGQPANAGIPTATGNLPISVRGPSQRMWGNAVTNLTGNTEAQLEDSISAAPRYPLHEGRSPYPAMWRLSKAGTMISIPFSEAEGRAGRLVMTVYRTRLG